MTNSWLQDCFCFVMRFKYAGNPWRLTSDTLGREYAPVLLIEACLGERALPLSFHGFVSPYPEFKGCHFRDSIGMIRVLYDSTDEVWEQVRTKAHEVGELVDRRLSGLWPEYGVVSETYNILAGDQRYDTFADSLAKGVILLLHRFVTFIVRVATGDWNSVEQLLQPYAKLIAETVGEFRDWAAILAALVLLIIAALVKVILQSVKHSIESFIMGLATIFEFVLTFFTRLFYLDEESNLTEFGGAKCA